MVGLPSLINIYFIFQAEALHALLGSLRAAGWAFLTSIPANVRVGMASECIESASHFFSFEIGQYSADRPLLINTGGHPASALHSDVNGATKSHWRAAKPHSQRRRLAGRDWPVNKR